MPDPPKPTRPKSAKTDTKLIDRLKKEEQILALRRQGLTWDMIGQQLGYKNGSGPFKIWQKAYKRALEHANETVDELRWNEIGRCESIMRGGLFARAQKGELPAVDRFLAVQKAIRELRGLDAPKAVTVDLGGPIATEAADIASAVRNLFGEKAAVPKESLGLNVHEPETDESNPVDESPGNVPGDAPEVPQRPPEG